MGGPGGRDLTLAMKRLEKTAENHLFFVKKNYLKNIFFKDIPSSYAKILGGNSFQSREFLSKWMKSRRRRKKRRKRKKVGENKSQLHFVHHHGWRTQARLDQNQLLCALCGTVLRVNPCNDDRQ